MKKIKNISVKIFVLIMAFTMALQTTFAAELSNIFDVRVEDATYTSSQASDILFPYIRAMSGKLILDKDVSKSGINISKDKIEITSTYAGVQIFISGTEIIYKGKTDQAILIAPKVTVDGESTNTLVVIANNVDINESAKLADLVLKATNTNMNGTVSGNVLGTSTKIDIKGTISNELRINTQRIDVLANKITGQVIIDTFNPALTVKYAYPDAKINVLENKVKLTNEELRLKLIEEIKSGLIAILSFGLIFLITRTLIKKEKLKDIAKLVKGNVLFTVIMGVISVMLIPIDICLILFLIIAGIKQIGIAALLIYVAIIVSIYLLAPFIVGTLIFLMFRKSIVLVRKEIIKDVIIALVLFLVLYGLTRIPVAGIVFRVIYLVITLGSVVTVVCKKLDNKM